MKKIALLLFILTVFQGFSQTTGISYQAVILNPQAQEIPGVNIENNILANTTVGIQFTILDAIGNEEYQEHHTAGTDRYGMLNLLIGTGTITSINNFSKIFWNGTTKKLKVAIDFNGGSNYTPLSEQDLTYMPQPPSERVSLIISNNTDAIGAEEIRATAVEEALASEVAINTPAIALNTSKLSASANATNQGNTFNGISQLVQIDATGKLPPIDGSQLTNLPTVSITNLTKTATTTDVTINSSTGTNITLGSASTSTAGVMTKEMFDAQVLNTAKVGYTDALADARVVTAITNKVDKETDKGLSTEDYTTAEKTKVSNLSGINSGDQDLSTLATTNDVNASLSLKEGLANKNLANGYAGLDSNKKIDVAQLPGITLNNVFTVTDEATQLALIAIQGDVAIRIDISKNYIHNGGTTGDISDWTELVSPGVAVSTVNGKIGDVILGITDIETLQTNLDTKATDISNLQSEQTTQDTAITAINSLITGAVYVGDANGNSQEVALSNLPLSSFGAADTDVDFGTNKLINVTDPTNAQDAATKNYVDAAANGVNTLANGNIYLGNVSNVSTEVTLSGDVSMTNAGVVTIESDAVTTTKIIDAAITNAKLDKATIPLSGFGSAAADIALGGNKLTGVENPTDDQDAATKNYVDAVNSGVSTLANGNIYVGDVAGEAQEVVLSGDVTIDNAGVSIIGANKVVTGMITDTNVTDAKLDKVNIPLSGFGSADADVDLGTNKLINVTDPTSEQDAATKKYVDGEVVSINTLTDGKVSIGNVSNVATEVTLSGDISITNTGVVAIESAAVTNAKLDKVNIPLSGFGSADADVDLGTNKLINVTDPTSEQDAATKKYVDGEVVSINTLTDGKVSIGNVSNVATEVTLSGDISITNTGVVAIESAAVTNAKLDKANIPLSGFGSADSDVDLGTNKLINVTDPTSDQDAATKKYVDAVNSGVSTLANGNIYVGDVAGEAQEVVLSGDVTIDNAGVSNIGANKVVTGMITDTNVTDAKLDKANIPLSGFGSAVSDVDLGDFKLTDVAQPVLDQDAATKKYVDDENIQYGFSLFKSATQALPSNSNSTSSMALITWDNEEDFGNSPKYNTGGFNNNDDSYTVQVSGVYFLNARLRFNDLPGGSDEIKIEILVGTKVVAMSNGYGNGESGNYDRTVAISKMYYCVAGDKITVKGGVGGSYSATLRSEPSQVYFEGYKL